MTVFEELVRELSGLEEIEAIALGGSRAYGTSGPDSDYDLYIYMDTRLPEPEREALLSRYCSHIELSNQYWELEDDCTLKDGTDIDIIYRSLDDTAKEMRRIYASKASNGYSTTLWHNLLHARVLHDKYGRLARLQKRIDQPIPEKLKENIIARNRALLSGKLPSYDRQLEKAVKRQDLPAVNHRTAAFLESYFDVLFARNGVLHPGEKRMMQQALELEILPEDFEKDLKALFESQYTDSTRFLDTLQALVRNLDKVL